MTYFIFKFSWFVIAGLMIRYVHLLVKEKMNDK